MTPTQIRLAVYGGMLLLAWWCSRRGSAPVSRVTRELGIDANVLSPTFGLTDDEIARKTNPAVDPEMRRLIDESNRAIAATEWVE